LRNAPGCLQDENRASIARKVNGRADVDICVKGDTDTKVIPQLSPPPGLPLEAAAVLAASVYALVSMSLTAVVKSGEWKTQLADM
jgi:uncharacterized protein (UPF0218 family)